MKCWWCMECQAKVVLNKQGRCEVCESEGVDLLGAADELNRSVSMGPMSSDQPSARA